jgi:phosphonate transport system substrate-binding protein
MSGKQTRGENMFNIAKLRLILLLGSVGIAANLSADPLVIGRVSSDPNHTYSQMKPIVDYVAHQLQDIGITEGAVLVAKNHDEMIGYLRTGKVDWVQKGVFEALMYNKKAGAEIMLRSWREGVPNYHTVIFSRTNSGISSLKDLVGKKMAFQDRGSTSAFFVPSAILKRAGFELVELSSPKEAPPFGKVGYVFAGKELSITTWVHRGLADAGAYHNQNWDKPSDNPEPMKKDLKIIYAGKPMPRMIELLRKDLDPRIKARIKAILLRAHEDSAAWEALQAYGPRTAKFDEFVGQAKRELNEATDLLQYFGRID